MLGPNVSTATNIISQLSALQHADSFFPSGAISFSQGLETLYADREVKDAATLATFVEGQLLYRWASMEAPALVLAHRSAGDLAVLVEIDAEIEAMSLATELREGSRRAGVALLSVHEKLGTTPASAYRLLIAEKKAFGHLPVAQGLVLTESFYWDLNDRTRAFWGRMKGKTGAFCPNQMNAGGYSATLHYLKTVAAMGTAEAKVSGRETMARMKAMPTDDDCFGPGSIRADGRKMHPAYLFQVKSPEEQKAPFDYYKLLGATPAEQAFRPLSQGGCPLV